jgi:hypothetical protein
MRVEFNNPEFPKGIEMDVGGLLIVNGETVEVTDEQIELFQARNGITLAEALSANQFATVDGVSYIPASTPEVSYDEPTGDEISEEGEN